MSEQSQIGASVDGTVMLDIGGDIGALIIMTPAEMLHVEIEVSPVEGAESSDESWSHSLLPHQHDDHEHGDHEHGDHEHTHHRPGTTHVAVRERIGPGGVRYAAIFPGLRSGDYTIWNVDGSVRQVVQITGGAILTVTWED